MWEKQWPVLGTRRFWLITFAVIGLVALYFGWRVRQLGRDGALAPVVTIMGLHEAAPGQTLRYAVLVRSSSGGPIPGVTAKVGFYKTSFTELGSAVTGPSGDATVSVKFPDDFHEARKLIAFVDYGVAEGNDALTVSPKSLGKPSTFITTDKPIYQPGQTVHLRALSMGDTKPIVDASATIEIQVAGTKIFRQEKKTSAFGVVGADFTLADQVKLGTYTITVTLKGAGGLTFDATQTFEVKRYSLPKLSVDVADLSPLRLYKPFSGTVKSTWIFGEPVKKAEVQVTFLTSAGTEAFKDKGVTDEHGSYRFEWKEASPLGETNKLRVKVIAPGGMANEKIVPVTPVRAPRLAVFPEGGFYVRGVEQSTWVVVTDGEPRSGLEVRVLPNGPSAKTDDNGIAKLTVLPTFEEEHIKIGGKGIETVEESSDRGLIVRVERDTWAAGDKVPITIVGSSLRKGDPIAVRASKRDEPLAMGACFVEDNKTCRTTLELPKDVSGLVWLHAMSLFATDSWEATNKMEKGVGRPDILVGKRLVMVGGGDRDLALKVAPDKPVYAPRETGKIDVNVTAAGGVPEKASLGVAVADEAVFALSQVRPDLEKIFFVIDKDIKQSKAEYRTGKNEKHVPGVFEGSSAYQAETPETVRSVILAALSTNMELGGFADATDSQVRTRASEALRSARRKTDARFMVVTALIALLAFLGFGVYGWTRLRGSNDAVFKDTPSFDLEARGLFFDFLVAALLPPLIAFFSIGSRALFGAGSSNDERFFAEWAAIGLFMPFLLLRSVRRFRREMFGVSPTLAAAASFLPPAIFFGHAAVILFCIDHNHRARSIFVSDAAWLVLPVLIAIAAQLTWGLMAVIRHSARGPVTRGRRIWHLLSRATLVGLPGSLIFMGFIVARDLEVRKKLSWTSFNSQHEEVIEEEAEERYRYEAAAPSDNKEGGTGTRAKGEEGSMGNPNTMNTAKRYGVRGPSDNDDHGKAQAPVTRDFFPETLLWAPDVVTDDKGHAQIQLPFADSITTWRFGLKAVSAAGRLGSATAPLIVKQDFFVEASLPPLLTQGDEVAMPLTVFGYTEAAQDVSIEVEGEGITTLGPAKMNVHIAPKSSQGLRLGIRADKAGERVVKIKAIGSTRSDALERKVTIVPNGMPVVRTIDGHLVGARTIPVELPANAIDGGNDLSVKIYGGPLSLVSEGLDGVFQMPHGCFEQTSSTTYPSVLALQFLKQMKAVSPDLQARAERNIAEGYQRLISFEVPGGGFSIFGRAPAHVAMTAYGLLEFSEMAGVSTVDEDLLRRTRDWLYRSRTDKDTSLTTAYVAWAIASAKTLMTGNDDKLAGLLDEVERASGGVADDAYGLALRINALQTGGRKPDALLKRLEAMVVRDESGAHWSSKTTGVMGSSGASMDVEVTGLATHALARAGMNPELRASAISWLVGRRMYAGTWSTTQGTIAAMRALLDEAKPASDEPQDVLVSIDGVLVETLKIDRSNRDLHRLVGLRKSASTGKHDIEIKTTGKGDVGYQIVSKHYIPWQKQPGAGLTLDVAYNPAAIPVGGMTTASVKLNWKGAEPARMPIIQLAIPPSFEVDRADLDKLANVQTYTFDGTYVTLYLTELAGAFATEVPLRATREAKVIAVPSRAYLYYEPEVRSETSPLTLRIQ